MTNSSAQTCSLLQGISALFEGLHSHDAAAVRATLKGECVVWDVGSPLPIVLFVCLCLSVDGDSYFCCLLLVISPLHRSSFVTHAVYCMQVYMGSCYQRWQTVC